jgi:REP element-mobilizing transposase RayT
MYNQPLAYFITFTTYGTWLHGDSRNSVIRNNNFPKLIAPNSRLYLQKQQTLKYPPVRLNSNQRSIVLETVIRHSKLKNWNLFAVHVRSTHIHAILYTNRKVDTVMTALKTWSTRQLRSSGYKNPKFWTVNGSKKYIFTDAKLRQKIHYVIYEQGTPMQYYLDDSYNSAINNAATEARWREPPD